MVRSQKVDKMKRLMQSIANEKDEVPIAQLLLTAQLANLPLTAAQQKLYFNTPYANRYAATYEVDSPRSSYGLECAPRSVKWRAFDEAVKNAQFQSPAFVERGLKHYADKELALIADTKRRADEEAAFARKRAEETGKKQDNRPLVSDDQLRMIHKAVKQRLATQFSDIRTAFRKFDSDGSGCISASECTDALLSMNVGVPRKWVDHLVNIADYDRDGEINYAEFARILTCDDIVTMKREGAEEEGLVQVTKDFFKPGILKSEMRSAQGKVRDMLFERGGLTKMFRAIDEDKSGACSRQEVRQLIMNLNLESIIRPAILEELINLMDVDGDDSIKYNEFARVCTSDDVFDMKELVQLQVKEEPKKKLTKKQRMRANRLH